MIFDEPTNFFSGEMTPEALWVIAGSIYLLLTFLFLRVLGFNRGTGWKRMSSKKLKDRE